MKQLSRNDWIAAGFAALDHEGYKGVSAENLARRLNVTRGSFYHHFRHREDYVRALLTAWEDDYAQNMLAYAATGQSAGGRLTRYLHAATRKHPSREIAIRAWALHDPLAAEFQQRVDNTRLAFAIETSAMLARSPEEATIIGQAAHMCLIGADQAGLRRRPGQFNLFVQSAVTLFKGIFPPR